MEERKHAMIQKLTGIILLTLILLISACGPSGQTPPAAPGTDVDITPDAGTVLTPEVDEDPTALRTEAESPSP